MSKFRRLAYLCLFAVSLSAQSQEPLGSISGVLQVSDGKPSGSVSVGYMRLAPLNQAAPKASGATTNANGAFTLSGLAAGTYMICVRSTTSSALLDPCVWSTTPTIVNLLPGQNLTGQTIAVQKAAVLEIQVADPTAALANNEAKTAGGYFVLGVSSPKHIFLQGIVANQTSAVRTYQLALPTGSPLNLTMNTKLYKVQDADAGTAINPGPIKKNFVIPAGTTKQTVNLKITGLAIN